MTFLKIFALVVFVAGVNAAPNEPVEKEETLQSIGKTCRPKVSVTDQEYQELMDKKLPTTKDAKCLLACIYKTVGILGDDGLISEEGSLACAAKKYKDDPAKKELLLEVIKSCFKVNSAAVSDGAAGCERAALNLECLLNENSAIVTGFD